jgi:adenylate cyclase
MEIERKWLIDKYTALNLYQRNDLYEFGMEAIRQFYTLIEQDKEIRYRITRDLASQHDYFTATVTTKLGSGMCREENEFVIPFETYSQKMKDIVGNEITKFRHLYQLRIDENTDISMGLDCYTDSISKVEIEWYFIAEIEFPTIKEANSFVAPSWFGKEVTDDPDYKSKNLALNGLKSWSKDVVR